MQYFSNVVEVLPSVEGGFKCLRRGFWASLTVSPQYPHKWSRASFWIPPLSGLLPITCCTTVAYGVVVKLPREVCAVPNT